MLIVTKICSLSSVERDQGLDHFAKLFIRYGNIRYGKLDLSSFVST